MSQFMSKCVLPQLPSELHSARGERRSRPVRPDPPLGTLSKYMLRMHMYITIYVNRYFCVQQLENDIA